MYFSFLSFYTRALVPLSIIGTFFWLGSKGLYAHLAELVGLETWARTGGPKELGYGWSWSWVYATIVSLWAVGFVEVCSCGRLLAKAVGSVVDRCVVLVGRLGECKNERLQSSMERIRLLESNTYDRST